MQHRQKKNVNRLGSAATQQRYLRMISLAEQGLSIPQIANAIQMTEKSVQRRLKFFSDTGLLSSQAPTVAPPVQRIVYDLAAIYDEMTPPERRLVLTWGERPP